MAQKLIRQGGIRIDGARITRPSVTISTGATLTIAYANSIRILKMLLPGTKRGPASEAQTLYEDLTPPPPPKPDTKNIPSTGRPPGTGRPTKKERRQTTHLLGR